MPISPILNGTFGSRRCRRLAKPQQRNHRVDFAEFAAKLARRRAGLSDAVVMPRKPGQRRTASKRALLEAIKATGADW